MESTTIAGTKRPQVSEEKALKRAKVDTIAEFVESNQLTGDKASWVGKSFISVGQLDRPAIDLAISLAADMKTLVEDKGGDERMKGKVLACVFYEPSTRTCSSFQAAMQRLGGTTIYVTESSSSVKKGETLGDTMNCLASYCDAIVLRHPRKGSAFEGANAIEKPLLNAGDGPGEHPTQALLDLFTICTELGGVEGKTITLLGDLKYGRTVHSLVRLLKFFPGVKLNYVSPESLQMPGYVKEDVAAAGVEQNEMTTFEEVLPETDVLYVTRVQQERFEDPEEYERVRGVYVVDAAALAAAKAPGAMVVMHPLPRVGEVAEDVDADPRAAYFRQMGYGMHMRMALLALALGAA